MLRRVPRGQVTTYGELAAALGTRAYRAVGQAMRRNPCAPEVPCHRVVRSSGEVGGFARGTPAKIAMLRREGIAIANGKVEDLARFLYRFS